MLTARLMTLLFILSIAVTACHDDDKNTASEAPQATQAPATEQAAVPRAQNDTMAVAKGTTEKQAIAKLGQPDISESHSIDSLKITYLAWHEKSGTLSAQFHNGVAKFSQFVPTVAN